MCNTMTLNEELGRIQFILSDKTGTLTENNMVAKHFCIGFNDIMLKGKEATIKISKNDEKSKPIVVHNFDKDQIPIVFNKNEELKEMGSPIKVTQEKTLRKLKTLSNKEIQVSKSEILKAKTQSLRKMPKIANEIIIPKNMKLPNSINYLKKINCKKME